ncbi:MAG TPA: hypothetical protein VK577_17350 [Bradyrhizobium sp.]|nr:hypothetical protein [Bradyrhizobium sp.]
MRKFILPTLAAAVAASTIAYGQDYLSKLFRRSPPDQQVAQVTTSQVWAPPGRFSQSKPRVRVAYYTPGHGRHTMAGAPLRHVARHQPRTAVRYAHAPIYRPRVVRAAPVPQPQPRPLLMVVRDIPTVIVTVPRVDPFGTPVRAMPIRSQYEASSFTTDPLADNLFLTSAAAYIPPRAVCQEYPVDGSPVCNYQRPYLVYDQIYGSAFDISPDYMKYVDPRYSATLRYGG